MLPLQSVLRRYGAMPVVVSDSDLDEERWWSGLPSAASLEVEFSKVLPPAQSWSSNLKLWGTDDRNRIDLWSNDGTAVAEIDVRIDVRNISQVFLANVLTIARQKDWLIRTEEGRVSPPSFSKLLTSIQASSAFRFVEDPKAFLEALGKARENEKDDHK
jgi:hypothetical protein